MSKKSHAKHKHDKHTDEIVTHQHATIALKNATSMKLQVQNNKINTFGPLKGKWALYKEVALAPGQCQTTDLLENESHELMVYRNNEFLYMVRDTELYNGVTVELYETHFTLTDGLMC